MFAAPNSGNSFSLPVVGLGKGEQVARLDEVQRDGFLASNAVDWIRAQPFKAFGLYLQKFVNWFSTNNLLATQPESSHTRVVVLALTYFPLLTAAIVFALCRLHRLSPIEIYILGSYFVAAAGYSVFFTRIRFRVPFDYLLVILACGWLGHG